MIRRAECAGAYVVSGQSRPVWGSTLSQVDKRRGAEAGELGPVAAVGHERVGSGGPVVEDPRRGGGPAGAPTFGKRPRHFDEKVVRRQREAPGEEVLFELRTDRTTIRFSTTRTMKNPIA